jgi:hypothetical protein
MNDALRLVLLLVILGGLLAAAGALVARHFDPYRRFTRYLRQALKAEPEGMLTSRAAGRALAFNLDAGLLAILWDRGRKGYVYTFGQLVGGEMMIDNTVVMRAFKDEPRRPLDAIPDDGRAVVLRLVFDNPRDPEFELALWPGPEHRALQDAVQAGRRWLTGLEAIQRRTPPRTLTRPVPPTPVLPDEHEPPPWDEDEG